MRDLSTERKNYFKRIGVIVWRDKSNFSRFIQFSTVGLNQLNSSALKLCSLLQGFAHTTTYTHVYTNPFWCLSFYRCVTFNSKPHFNESSDTLGLCRCQCLFYSSYTFMSYLSTFVPTPLPQFILLYTDFILLLSSPLILFCSLILCDPCEHFLSLLCSTDLFL